MTNNDEDIDENDERTLRPLSWRDYIGQAPLVTQLRTKCQAAFKLERPLDHLLINGTQGSGKTTLAHLAADETGDSLVKISRPVNESELMQAIWDLPGPGVGILFIDEAHMQSARTQRSLLTLTEEGYIQTKFGTDSFPWLTVILATTEKRMISLPLQSRLTILDMDEYTLDEMGLIVEGMAERAGVALDSDTTSALAVAAVGVPRAARHLVLAAQELSAVGQEPTLDAILTHCRLDADGLSRDHLGYMRCLQLIGGQAGLEVLTVRLQLHRTEVQRIERLLVDRGYVRYDSRGRVLTGSGRARLEGKTLAPLRGGRLVSKAS